MWSDVLRLTWDVSGVRSQCCAASGQWVSASPALDARYRATAMREGDVYDSRLSMVRPLSRQGRTWKWLRNTSRAPSLLVFREEAHTASQTVARATSIKVASAADGVGRSERAGPRPQPLPTADAIDWSAALRGRVVVFVGDSLGEHQANSLLVLASDHGRHSVETWSRGFRPDSGESLAQTSWCRAICSKVSGPWSPRNLCRDAHTIVCWLSAAKAESPSMRERALGQVTAWLLATVTSLSSRDIVIGNAGHHFSPWDSNDVVLETQVKPFVNACTWDMLGQPQGAASHTQPAGSAARPHYFLKEASPQFWPEGVFPGRIGFISRKHDCLPPWSYERVQQAMQLPIDRRPPELTLEHLLGRRAFEAYNRGLCAAVAASPVGLLKLWQPSALLGSRESSFPGDCTHGMMHGSLYPYWNQVLLHAVWRRESLVHPQGGAASSPKSDSDSNRWETWRQLRQALSMG